MNERRIVLAWTALIFLGPGLASMLGQALTGVSEVQIQQQLDSESTAWTPVPAIPTPHQRPVAASRSRRQGNVVTGSLTDVTCYVATGNRTASGLWPQVGMAASNRYPFGTRLRVQHHGVVTVQDRIGHGSELDLFYASRADCIRFGRQQLRVEEVRP